MREIFTILLIFIIGCFHTIAQKKITGSVTDTNGNPLFGVNIVIREVNTGVASDIFGKYEIKGDFEGKHTIEFSYLGYKKEIKKIDFSSVNQILLNTTLLELASDLNNIEIVTKGALRKAREQAYAVTVIKTEDLYNTGSNLNEVLNSTAGVRVRQDGGLGSSFSFSLNGFSGKQVKFFLDGIPMDNFGSSLTLNNFPINLAENIEIYKGVIPITLGSDALGGAVNIVTRKDANYLDASYGYGSFNTHKTNINYAFTSPKTGFTTRAKVFHNYSDNNFKVKVAPIDLQTNQRLPIQYVKRFHDKYQSATANLEMGVVNKPYADKLIVGLIASKNDKEIQTGVIMDQVFGARTTNSTSLIPTLKYYKKDIFTDGLDIKLNVAYNTSKNKFIDTTKVKYNWLKDKINTTSAEAYRSQLENKESETIVTSNIAYELTKQHQISVNYQFSNFNRESKDIENPNNISLKFPQGLQKQTYGLAYQAKFKQFNGTLFSKYYHLKANTFKQVLGSTNIESLEIALNNFGHGVAMSYFLGSKIQIKTSFERTFRLPEVTDLLGDGLFIRRNIDLKPENSLNFNLGLSYEKNLNNLNKLKVDVNYLLRKSENFIRLDQSQSQPVDRQFVNIGKVNTTGYEINLEYDWKKRLHISSNITYQNIIDKQQFLSSTNLSGTSTSPNFNYNFRVPNIPYLYGNLNLNYNISKINLKNKFQIGYSLNYVKEYFFTPNQLGANNQDNIPTQLSHNALISYAIDNGKFNISFEVDNITNEDLFDNYLLQKPGRSLFINFRYFISKTTQ